MRVLLTWEMERVSTCLLWLFTGMETAVPWVPVLTAEFEPSVVIDTSLWLLQPPWLQRKTN